MGKYSSYSSEKSSGGGKYKARVYYSVTNESFSWQWEVNVTNKFDKSYYFWVRWKNASGNWVDWRKSNSKHNADLKYSSTSVRNLGRQILEVQVGVGNGSSSPSSQVTIPAITRNVTAKAPSKISVKKLNDAHYVVYVTGEGYPTRPTNKLVLERATDTQNSWSEITELTINATGSYTNEELHDQTTSAGHKYWYRVKAVNTIGGDSDYKTIENAEYTAPVTNEDVSVTINGNVATISWSVDDVSDIDKGIISGWYVEKSTNGGAYTREKPVYAVASQYNYSTTVSVSSGATYQFRVVAFGSGGTSFEGGGQDGGETRPSAPYSVKAYRNVSDNIVINISDSSSNTAEDVIIERSIDGGAWVQIASEDFPCETYTDTTALASDTVRYRVKNVNDAGSSAYTESLDVLMKSKPNAPSLISPVNGAVVNLDAGTVRLVWRHNSTDGSPQRQAELQYKTGSTWTTVSKTTESYYDLSLVGYSANNQITWRARTKGSHNDWSEYSDEYTIILLEKPEIHIITPVNSSTITTLPIVVQYSYNDNSGVLEALEFDIIKDDEVVKTFIDTEKDGEFSLAGFLFDNEYVYGIRVRALSSSGLRADDLVSVTIQYEEISIEGGLLLTIDSDENGYAYVTALRDITDDVEPVDIVEAYVYRVHDNERELVGDVNEGTQLVDELAPINVPYYYELLQLDDDGNLSLMRYETVNESEYSFIYYGEEIFKAKWNQTVSPSLKRPERVEKRYSGRKYPVSYDSLAIEEKCSYNTVLTDREDLVKLKTMMRKGNGHGIFKSVDGDSYFANFEFSYDTNGYDLMQSWNVNLDVTRVEQ